MYAKDPTKVAEMKSIAYLAPTIVPFAVNYRMKFKENKIVINSFIQDNWRRATLYSGYQVRNVLFERLRI